MQQDDQPELLVMAMLATHNGHVWKCVTVGRKVILQLSLDRHQPSKRNVSLALPVALAHSTTHVSLGGVCLKKNATYIKIA